MIELSNKLLEIELIKGEDKIDLEIMTILHVLLDKETKIITGIEININ